LVGVEQRAEVRRMKRVEGLSAREIARRTGLARDTVSRLLAAKMPPRYVRSPSGSILDPFKEWICEELQADPKVPSQRLRELAGEIGYRGRKTVFDDHVREVRPRLFGQAHLPADCLSPGRSDPVRSVGAE
jgi:transposase